jgi:UDP-N-acetylglucosamine 2-epimerase (non-hydrolysing)
MKIMTVLGTRPEIIRLSRLIPKLDALCDHVLVHTGQNFDPSLSDVFFRDLDVRAPDVSLGVRADSFGEQAGQILAGAERAIRDHRPDRLLILGDTNSGLAAIVAKRMGVPVFHMEPEIAASTTAFPRRRTGGSSTIRATCCSPTPSGAARTCCAKGSHRSA